MDQHDTGQPGTEGIRIFIFIDMIVFLLMFLVYLSERHRIPDVFAESQHHLNALYGLANTLILLTSSWFMVEGVVAARRNLAGRATIFLGLALLMGTAFSINKLFEYGAKLGAGITPATNSFFTMYFVITFLHFLHVLGGMTFIAHCLVRARREVGTIAFRKKVENVGMFWHFVDMLWLFIFPMIYLAGLK